MDFEVVVQVLQALLPVKPGPVDDAAARIGDEVGQRLLSPDVVVEKGVDDLCPGGRKMRRHARRN